FTVVKAGSTTTLGSSNNPQVAGNSIVFTATVTSSAGGTPTGTVTFTVDSVPGTPVALNGAGQATPTTSFNQVCSHAIFATYNGEDADYSGSTSSPPLNETITSGPASVLVFSVQPSNTAANAKITPAVQVTVKDALGNVVTSPSLSI